MTKSREGNETHERNVVIDMRQENVQHEMWARYLLVDRQALR